MSTNTPTNGHYSKQYHHRCTGANESRNYTMGHENVSFYFYNIGKFRPNFFRMVPQHLQTASSVQSSVCLSRAGTTCRQMNAGSRRLCHHLVAHRLVFETQLSHLKVTGEQRLQTQLVLLTHSHSLTSRPSSMRVGDSRRPLRYLSSPLCSIL